MGELYVPESAMAIVAHPDDIEFSCAGTIARWRKHGSRISYVLCTSGDVGIDEPGMTREKAAKIREKEQTNAAAIIGVQEVIYLRYPDGRLEASMELRKRLVREIRKFKPEAVICGDPTIVWAGDDYINHPDHRAAATSALDAVFPAAGQPNLFQDIEEEGFAAHKPRKVFVMSWEGGDTFINIEETIDLKIEALRAHISQMKGNDPAERIKMWAAAKGKGKEMEFAESYRVVSLVSDEDWNKRRKKN